MTHSLNRRYGQSQTAVWQVMMGSSGFKGQGRTYFGDRRKRSSSLTRDSLFSGPDPNPTSFFSRSAKLFMRYVSFADLMN